MDAVPIRDGKDALAVNRLELEIAGPKRKVTQRFSFSFSFSFITNLPVGRDTVADLAARGRTRRSIETETLHTKPILRTAAACRSTLRDLPGRE